MLYVITVMTIILSYIVKIVVELFDKDLSDLKKMDKEGKILFPEIRDPHRLHDNITNKPS